MNKVFSVLLALSILLLGYPLFDGLGIQSSHLTLLGTLILLSIGALVWNFFKARVTKVLGTLVAVNLLVGLVQLYYLFTLTIY